jgi:hypothetical protein
MALRDERKGENESFFRELNERLENNALGRTELGDGFQIVCECAVETCTARVRVSFAEYESVRADAKRFIVAADHVDARCERVVGSHAGHDVVEKFGEAAELAVGLDPRSHQ